jgi:hypothetical protein
MPIGENTSRHAPPLAPRSIVLGSKKRAVRHRSGSKSVFRFRPVDGVYNFQPVLTTQLRSAALRPAGSVLALARHLRCDSQPRIVGAPVAPAAKNIPEGP